MINFSYSRPREAATAVQAATKDASSRFIAGGTNLVDLMKRGVMAPEKLIDITEIPMASIEMAGNGSLTIGAMALNSDVADHAEVKTNFPLLSMAINAGASAQIRNMASTGGNLVQRTRCSYFYDTSMPCNKRNPGSGCGALKGYNRMHAIFGASDQCVAVHPSDMCVALAALDATVKVQGPAGERTIPFTSFHRLPGSTPQRDNELQQGELITSISIPANNFRQKSHYLKVRDRSSYAFALVSVAAALQMNGSSISKAAIALGGVAHKPWRLTAAENYLAGKPATEASFRAAAVLAMKEAKPLQHNKFKIKMAENSIVSAMLTAANK